MDEIDFTSDSFGDILARDRRYDARAYALLVDVLQYLFSKDEHVDATAILDEFRERTLDQYGPMSYSVLREWGVERSKEGRAVYDAWQEVEARFPGVRATYNAIMPDHFHGIVYITVEGRVNLGEVVAFFAAEAERRIGRRVWCGLWRDSVCIARGQLDRQIKYILANPNIIPNNNGAFRTKQPISRWYCRFLP